MWVELHGSTYRIRDWEAGKKVTVKAGFPNKTLAKRYMTHLLSDKFRGKSLVHRGGELELGEWIDEWWPAYQVTLKPSSRTSAEGMIGRYIKPMLGGHELDDITRLTIGRWIADLKAGKTKVAKPRPLSRKTIANAHGLLHKIFSDAVEERLIPENPCNRTKLGQAEHHEMMFLTEQQADALIRALPEYWQPFVLFLLGTGCRWSEAVGIRARDIDLLERRVSITKALHELHHAGGFVEVEPKTRAGRRSLKITLDLALTLTPLLTDLAPGDQVFKAPKGGNVRYAPFRKHWVVARELAGVPTCRIHDLRHTHASWLIASDVRGGLTAIQRRLGHSSIRVTSDLYGHLLPETDDSIVDALDARMPRLENGGTVGALDAESNGIQRDSETSRVS